ncbi:MAG: hypothetical protein FWF20_02735 [Betaproteobacteria bacterium]|nr:hypothetical protein [Betaproteobacteria bacterium]
MNTFPLSTVVLRDWHCNAPDSVKPEIQYVTRCPEYANVLKDKKTALRRQRRKSGFSAASVPRYPSLKGNVMLFLRYPKHFLHPARKKRRPVFLEAPCMAISHDFQRTS